MAEDLSETKAVLRAIWDAGGDAEVALDDECSPTKVCRNMQGITFDGYAPEGTDLQAAWRQRLQAEGKLAPSGDTLRDLVLGRDGDR
jgi:hypothetical protein